MPRGCLATWDDMDRPPGHMELISPVAFLKLATIVVVVYLVVAAATLCHLFRKKVRAAFRDHVEATSRPEERPPTHVD